MVISSMHNVNVIVLSSYKVEYPMIETTTATVFTYIYYDDSTYPCMIHIHLNLSLAQLFF